MVGERGKRQSCCRWLWHFEWYLEQAQWRRVRTRKVGIRTLEGKACLGQAGQACLGQAREACLGQAGKACLGQAAGGQQQLETS